MNLVFRSFKVLKKHLVTVSWWLIFGIFIFHFGMSWYLLKLAAETKLVELTVFPYYYVTTATSVGYGDLSPGSVAGRMVGALWVLPGAVIIFTSFVTKSISVIAERMRKAMQGKKDYSKDSDHIVLIGWRQSDTIRMIELLLQERIGKIILITIEKMENPMPEHIHFVRDDAYSPAMLIRAGISNATTICVNEHGDPESLAVAMMAREVAPNPHMVVHFHDVNFANTLSKIFPEVECCPSMTVDTMLRSMMSPGVSRVVSDMLSHGGMCQYVGTIPKNRTVIGSISFDELIVAFRKHGALPIAIDVNGIIDVNPATNALIRPGTSVWYIAMKKFTDGELYSIFMNNGNVTEISQRM